MLCQFCGWGFEIPPCKTEEEAISCGVNKENVRKFELRHRPEKALIVYSERYQGKEGKGDSSEQLKKLK